MSIHINSDYTDGLFIEHLYVIYWPKFVKLRICKGDGFRILNSNRSTTTYCNHVTSLLVQLKQGSLTWARVVGWAHDAHPWQQWQHITPALHQWYKWTEVTGVMRYISMTILCRNLSFPKKTRLEAEQWGKTWSHMNCQKNYQVS